MAMKLMSMIFFAHVLEMMAISVVASPSLDEDYNEGMGMETSAEAVPLSAEIPAEAEETTSLRGVSRFLSHKRIFPTYTCNYFPRVCRAKNSPGPDCCKKKCVNVKTDRYNCGACGRRCKYTEICCKGKCVNVSFDKRNCAGCQQKCKKGEYCVHGMCNYA